MDSLTAPSFLVTLLLQCDGDSTEALLKVINYVADYVYVLPGSE